MAHPLYVWLRKRIRLDIFNITCGDSHLGQLLKDLLRQYKYTVGFIIALNCIAALFEGSTMGALLLALDVLLGEKTGPAQDSLRIVQSFLVTIEERFGRGGIFAFYVGLAVLSQLLRSGFQFLGRAATAYLQAWCEQDLRSRVFRQFFSIRYDHVVKYKIGDMALYTHQTNGMVNYLGYLNALVSDFLILVTYVCVLLWISWPITLLAVVTLGLLSLGLSRVIRVVRSAATEFVKATVRMNEQIVEYLQGIRTVRAFAQEEYVQGLVDETLREAMLANRKSLVWEATILPLVECLTVLCVAALLVFCYSLLDVNEQAWLPRLAVYVFVVYRLMPRAGTINSNLAALKRLYPTVSRVAAILRQDNKPYMQDGGRDIRSLQDGIEFRNVTFRYDGTATPAVRDLSFFIAKGTMTAIVGESGAGKSTVLDLILRLYDPTAGAILADGIPLPEYDQKAWRNLIGMVNQDIHIFNASIHQNIAFRRPDADREEVERAARIANAHEFILELPNGYDTVVGERGMRLSGGQRQRIAIARAVLHDAPILILDEATSELDSHIERKIQESIARLSSDRTIIAVAHRLSTISMADQILVLESGRLVEQGTHSELLDLSGIYASLWRIQSQSEEKVRK